MRILIVSGIFPPDIGGPASYVPAIGSDLTAAGHEVIVLTLSDSLSQRDEHYPFRTVRLPRRIPRLFRWILTVAAILRHGARAGVWYVNGLAMEASLARLVLRKPMVIKVVGDLAWERAVNHGWTRETFEEFQRARHRGRTGMMERLRSWWTRQARAVIVPSAYLGRSVEGWGVPRGRLRVIYNAVEVEAAGRDARAADETFTLITVARLTKWKGVDGILRSLAGFPEARLVVVGGGPERAGLEQLAGDLGLGGRVRFAGPLGRTETHALIARSDVFVLNSTYEGFPHVVVEAMRLGRPVVATRAGGTPEIVEDDVNGRLVEPGDYVGLRVCLKGLWRSPDDRQRLARAAAGTAARFGFQSMADDTRKVLEEAAA